MERPGSSAVHARDTAYPSTPPVGLPEGTGAPEAEALPGRAEAISGPWTVEATSTVNESPPATRTSSVRVSRRRRPSP